MITCLPSSLLVSPAIRAGRRAVIGYGCAALVLGLSVAAAHAQSTVTATIADTSTIKPAGPRTGTGNANFFNAEGNAYNANASFGVLQFTVGANASAGQVTSLTLTLTQSNAAFSVAGPLNFYLTQDNTTVINNGGTSPLTFQSASLPDGIGTQLAPRDLIGTGNYTVVSSGTIDTFTLGSLSAADRNYLNSLYTNGGTLRLLVAPAADSTAATYGGINSTFGAPTLTLAVSAVPELSTDTALALSGGLLMIVLHHRRLRAA